MPPIIKTCDLGDPERLALLADLDLLRPQDDGSLDHVTQLASLATGCETALITFLSPQGQWVAAKVGWDQNFHPLAESFCVHTLRAGGLLQVCDASRDARFQSNSLVTGAAGVRFYAGQPIVFEKHLLGAVCVLDRRHRSLTEVQIQLLHHCAQLVAELLRTRLEHTNTERERAKSAVLTNALQRSEATLRESEERYRLLWQTTTDAVLIINADGIIQFANPATAAVFGRSPESLLGQTLALLQPPRLRPLHERAFQAYLHTGQRTMNWGATQTVGLRVDGTEVPIEVAFSELTVGGKRCFAAFIRDIAERHQVAQALSRSEAQFRALTALSSDWFWEVDRDFRYTFLSESAGAKGLLDPDAALGRQPWEARRNADDMQWQRFKRFVERRQPFRDFEIQQQEDGRTHVFLISGEPMFDGNGGFVGYRGVGRNVTEAKRSEALRQQLEDRLRDSQKLEAIGVLAGGIAHDFNNILAGILGNAYLALADLPAEHPAADCLQQIRKGGQRGREMVQQILTFARRKPQRPAHCELGELVRETMALMRPTIPTSIQVSALLPDRPLPVYADATQVEQALINLCANAWQAMHGRPGHIDIGVEDFEIDGTRQSLAPALPPGRYVHLFVRDDGPGMDEATAKRVFEPFFTTKPEGEGTGLGLAVVHGIVVGHHGAVTVDTALGRGTTFNVWLPADDTGEATEPAPLAESATRGDGKHILYVDDDEVMTLMTSRLLERLGYRVSAFSQGQDAIRRFESSPFDVDVVVTDLNMPGCSGVEVLRNVRAVRADVPVIIGSGNLPQELLDAARDGVHHTFHKQNTLEELPKILAEALATR